MSDDLVKSLEWSCRDPVTHEPIDDGDYSNATVSEVKQAIAEITRLRTALAAARCEGMEEAARLLEELHKNHKYNRKTGEGSEHDVGYYRAIAEGVAHILRAAAKEENRPSEEIIREDRDAWPDRQTNDPIRAAAVKDRQP